MSSGHYRSQINRAKRWKKPGLYTPPEDPPPPPPGGDAYWEPGDATFPYYEVPTDQPTSFGTEWFVDTWAELLNAVNNSVIGDVITLDADVRIQAPTSTSLFFPTKAGAGPGNYVTIRSSRHNLLPALPANGRYPGSFAHAASGIVANAGPLTVGNNPRVGPSHVVNMGKLRVAAASDRPVGNTPLFRFNPDSGGWYIWGIDIDCAQGIGYELTGMIRLGENGLYSLMSQMPHDIIIQQCRIHSNMDNTYGNPANFNTCRKAIYCGGRNIAVVNSQLVCEHASYGDDNAFFIAGGQGPYTVLNCGVHGSGENVLTGGTDLPTWHTEIYSDITFRHCHFWKPDEWKDDYPSKNPVEFKQGIRMLVEHCLLDGNWPSGQSGQGLSLKTVNQADGGGLGQTGVPAETGHVTFRFNRTQRVGSGYVLSYLETGGGAAGATGIPLHDVTIYHNVTDGTDTDHYSWPTVGPTNFSTKRCIFLGRGNRYSVRLADTHHLRFRNETFLQNDFTFIQADPASVATDKVFNCVFDSLLFTDADSGYGVKGGSTLEGNNTINGFADALTLTFENNILTGRNATSYNQWPANFFPADNTPLDINMGTGVLGPASEASEAADGLYVGRNGKDNGAWVALVIAGLSGVVMDY